MKAFDKSIIFDYINGIEIPDDVIESLEDDSNFMMQVITTTNDKNMLYRCSDRVKKDPAFIKLYISRFPHEKRSIEGLLSNFLNSNPERKDHIEILVLLSKYAEYKKHLYLLDVIYHQALAQVEAFKTTADIESVKKVGLGFIIFVEKYESSKIILNYFARRFLEEYMLGLFEKKMHEMFKTPNEIEKKGIINTIYMILNMDDALLADYVTLSSSGFHHELLDLFFFIKRRWSFYEEAKQKNTIENLLREFHHYYNNYILVTGTDISEDEFLYYIASELKIVDLIRKWDNFYKDDEVKALQTNPKMLSANMHLVDLTNYRKLKKVMIELLDGTYKRPTKEDLREDTSCTIIDFQSFVNNN